MWNCEILVCENRNLVKFSRNCKPFNSSDILHCTTLSLFPLNKLITVVITYLCTVCRGTLTEYYKMKLTINQRWARAFFLQRYRAHLGKIKGLLSSCSWFTCPSPISHSKIVFDPQDSYIIDSATPQDHCGLWERLDSNRDLWHTEVWCTTNEQPYVWQMNGWSPTPCLFAFPIL